MIKDGVYLGLETMFILVRLLGLGLGLILKIFNEAHLTLVYANLLIVKVILCAYEHIFLIVRYCFKQILYMY